MGDMVYTGWLKEVTCCTCHMAFGLVQQFYDACQRDERIWFHCPRGHSQHFTADLLRKKNEEIERLKKKVDDEIANKQYWVKEYESADHSARTVKGILKKTRERLKGGKCPCCKRNFVAIGRHMATKHPDYGREERPH